MTNKYKYENESENENEYEEKHKEISEFLKKLDFDDINIYTNFLDDLCCIIEDEIKTTKKSLKDIIGKQYENHRKKLYIEFGDYNIINNKDIDDSYKPEWNADIIVTNKLGNIIALEETKGHYLDKCFLDRSIMNIAITIKKYQINNIRIPIFIIHSYTTYRYYQNQLDKYYSIFTEDIVKIIKDKLIYTTVSCRDRISTENWIKKDKKAYIKNITVKNIINDIKTIRMLKNM
ncbi:hypothetical protein JO84_gp344 [Aureococcus anophagefferens virus]|uniref:Uncharacterized protein n=1 Tax=Aureococcus anophagefferens virus TaxID=1474867 RepID=A0A076FM80_9VIRU|nr:hypothetical protein JO84_gp344 [Aureococcus anophagefferens virus]AII16993.1 hypothetical protein AaV_129 [Aureococcus anophagefferens virus]UOG94043.1 hypothetical protein MKD35_1 [Aureococcus anophagefferens virus]